MEPADSPSVVLPAHGIADEPQAQEPRSDLEFAAVWLQERSRKSTSVAQEAVARGVTEKSLLRRAHAAAEASLISQQCCLEKVLNYLKNSVAAGRLEAHAGLASFHVNKGGREGFENVFWAIVLCLLLVPGSQIDIGFESLASKC